MLLLLPPSNFNPSSSLFIPSREYGFDSLSALAVPLTPRGCTPQHCPATFYGRCAPVTCLSCRRPCSAGRGDLFSSHQLPAHHKAGLLEFAPSPSCGHGLTTVWSKKKVMIIDALSYFTFNPKANDIEPKCTRYQNIYS